MKRTAIWCGLVGVILVSRVLTFAAAKTIYVNCGVAPGGTGSKQSPVATVTAAMVVARAAGERSQRIEVEAGVCDDETLPIRLDVPVRLEGAGDDTVVTVQGPTTSTFFVIAADNVTISRLAIDGTSPFQPDVNVPTPSTPLGVSVIGVDDFELSRLTIEGMGQAVRVEASSGLVSRNSVTANSGMFIAGGAPGSLPAVTVSDNLIVYRVNGITVAGSAANGTSLDLTLRQNDVMTSFTGTGDTNPAGLRVSPAVTAGGITPGFVNMVVSHNRFGGTAKYGIVIHGGMPARRTDASYTGEIVARFSGNEIDSTVAHPSLVTFTNARGTVLPCEVSPLFPGCSGVGVPAWEYLTYARFDLTHSGEFDDALIDHPEFEAFDGHALHNVLLIDHTEIDYRTFVGGGALLGTRATRADRGAR